MQAVDTEQQPEKKKRGRPKGSKQKEKPEIKIVSDSGKGTITDEILADEEIKTNLPKTYDKGNGQTYTAKRQADFRPVMVRIAQRFILRERVVDEWAKLRQDLDSRDKLWFDLQLMKLGVDASPKDKQANQGSIIIFAISGIGSDKIQAQQVTVDVTNPPEDEEGFEPAP